jgi:hypothetical protein
MKKREEQLAQELDAFLTARLQNRPAPPLSAEIASERDLADTLLQAAARCEVDPIFLSSLEAQLVAAASSAKTSKNQPERPPFWHNLINTLQEGFTMKRMTFALGALMALLMIGYVAWFAWPGAREPEMIAEQPALRPLPGLSSATGMGGGMGGDGADMNREMLATEAEILPSPDIWWNPLSEAEYQLATALPTAPAEMPVYEQSGGHLFSREDADRIAALFGFSGGAYEEKYLVEDAGWTPPVIYHFFDGSRQLSVSDSYFFYHDGALMYNDEAGTLPTAQGIAIAEAFLRDTGLLDFSYEAVSPYGNEVEFRRVLNGHTIIFPEFQVSVHRSGQVQSVSHTPLNRLAAVGNYPLRTVEEAWQSIVSEGIDYRRSFFSIYAGPDFVQPQPPVDRNNSEMVYRYWERTYREGETVTLYSYPIVFVPLSDSEAPRIQVDRYLLEGPAAELWAITQQLGKQLYVKGIYRQRAGGAALELVEWQVADNVDYDWRQGSIHREGNRTLLISDAGERLLIAAAPADLPDGARIYIHGWLASEAEGSAQVFTWNGMGLLIEEENLGHDPLPGDWTEPERIRLVTINEITMLYSVAPIFDDYNEPPRYVVQPVWRFKGETNTNEIIEIYVQAVTDEFIQEQPIDGPIELDGPVQPDDGAIHQDVPVEKP